MNRPLAQAARLAARVCEKLKHPAPCYFLASRKEPRVSMLNLERRRFKMWREKWNCNRNSVKGTVPDPLNRWVRWVPLSSNCNDDEDCDWMYNGAARKFLQTLSLDVICQQQSRSLFPFRQYCWYCDWFCAFHLWSDCMLIVLRREVGERCRKVPRLDTTWPCEYRKGVE